MTTFIQFLRSYLLLGAIINGLPYTIQNGQQEDAVPVQANFDSIVSQVNSGVPALIPNLGSLTSFTPTLAFGGGNTGLTYQTQKGYYWPIQGGLTAFWLYVQLTNKGTSTGAATVGGLPLTINPNWVVGGLPIFPVVTRYFDIDYTAGGFFTNPIPSLRLIPNTTTLEVGCYNLTLNGTLSDTWFHNDSAVAAMGIYST